MCCQMLGLRRSPLLWGIASLFLVLARVSTAQPTGDPSPMSAPDAEDAPPDSAERRETPADGKTPDSASPDSADDNGKAAVLESANFARLLDKVEILRTERGRYGRGLDRALIELGRAYYDAGEHALAAHAFEQALFVARANYGLYSRAQLQPLKELIKANKALGQSRRVIDNYFLMYWIHKRQYGAQDLRLLPVIDEVSRAQSGIFLDDDQQMDREAFMERRRILQDAVEIVEANYGPTDPRVAGVLNRVAWANFALARQTGKLLHYREYKAARRGGTVFVDDSLSEGFTLIDETVRRGGDALDRIEDLYEERYDKDPKSAAYALALARLHKGDWELLYGSGTGRREYAEAYELLLESEEGEAAAERLLGTPQLLPAPVDFPGQEATEDETDLPPEDPARIIELSMDVAFTGRVRNAEVVEAPGALEENADRLVRYMKFQRFRPRVEEGRTVNSKISRRYYVQDDGTVLLLDRMMERREAQTAADGGTRNASDPASGGNS